MPATSTRDGPWVASSHGCTCLAMEKSKTHSRFTGHSGPLPTCHLTGGSTYELIFPNRQISLDFRQGATPGRRSSPRAVGDCRAILSHIEWLCGVSLSGAWCVYASGSHIEWLCGVSLSSTPLVVSTVSPARLAEMTWPSVPFMVLGIQDVQPVVL